MKKNINSILFLAVAGMILYSCSTSLDLPVETSAKTLTTSDTTIVDCFTPLSDITIYVGEDTITITSEEDFDEALEDWLIDMEPFSIEFPVDIELADGTALILNNIDDLITVLRDCGVDFDVHEGEDDDDADESDDDADESDDDTDESDDDTDESDDDTDESDDDTDESDDDTDESDDDTDESDDDTDESDDDADESDDDTDESDDDTDESDDDTDESDDDTDESDDDTDESDDDTEESDGDTDELDDDDGN